MHGGIGIEHRHAFVGEHRRDGRFTHPDRTGEPERQRPPGHDVRSARSSSSRSRGGRSEEHTSELQSLMRSSYAVFCLKKKIYIYDHITTLNIFPSLTN